MSATIKNKKAALDKEAKKPGKLLFEGVSLHEQRLLRYREYMNEREQNREKEVERLIDWMESAPTNKLASVLAYAISMDKDDAPEADRLDGAGLESDKSSNKSTPSSSLKADFFKFSIPGDASPDRVEDVRQRVSALGGTFDEVTSSGSSGAEPSTDTLPIQTPPLWAERTTGRDVSPVDWIKMHYGRMREDGSWEAMGLTRKTIGQIDWSLYLALATWIKRHPEDAFDTPPSRKTRATDKEEALHRRLETERSASKRYRHRKMSNS